MKKGAGKDVKEWKESCPAGKSCKDPKRCGKWHPRWFLNKWEKSQKKEAGESGPGKGK